jgi:hypothetical protein
MHRNGGIGNSLRIPVEKKITKCAISKASAAWKDGGNDEDEGEVRVSILEFPGAQIGSVVWDGAKALVRNTRS